VFFTSNIGDKDSGVVFKPSRLVLTVMHLGIAGMDVGAFNLARLQAATYPQGMSLNSILGIDGQLFGKSVQKLGELPDARLTHVMLNITVGAGSSFIGIA
jgi:hypothetical protein